MSHRLKSRDLVLVVYLMLALLISPMVTLPLVLREQQQQSHWRVSLLFARAAADARARAARATSSAASSSIPLLVVLPLLCTSNVSSSTATSASPRAASSVAALTVPRCAQQVRLAHVCAPVLGLRAARVEHVGGPPDHAAYRAHPPRPHLLETRNKRTSKVR